MPVLSASSPSRDRVINFNLTVGSSCRCFKSLVCFSQRTDGKLLQCAANKLQSHLLSRHWCSAVWQSGLVSVCNQSGIFLSFHNFVFYTVKLVLNEDHFYSYTLNSVVSFSPVATFYPDQTFTAQELKEVRNAHSLASKASNFSEKKNSDQNGVRGVAFSRPLNSPLWEIIVRKNISIFGI